LVSLISSTELRLITLIGGRIGMRRSFFKKLCFALLVLLWIGWAGFVYAAPHEWMEITALFLVLTIAFGGRMWTADRATVKEGGYRGEDMRWPEEKREPIQSIPFR
jgi:hypothetical protein